MTTQVRDAYDANAELYASLFLDELDRDAQSLAGLATLAQLAAERTGPVADLGCGPGSVVNHLCGLGVTAIGVDISSGQIAQARAAYPGHCFDIGDLTALDWADSCLGGIISRYSIIHLPPSDLVTVFREWNRVLEPMAPVFISFFGSRLAEAHGTPYDHKVVTAYELFPATIEQQLRDCGFDEIEIDTTPVPEGGRPFDHTIVLARKPGD